MSETHDSSQQLDLQERVRRVLEETRIILPFIGILMGFHLNSIFQPGFTEHPLFVRLVFYASFGFILISTVMLMAIPAFNRRVGRKSASVESERYATHMIERALNILALGFTGDVFLAVYIGLDSLWWSSAAAFVVFIFCMLLWMIYPTYRKSKNNFKN